VNTDSNHDGMLGETLASRYHIEALIGEGAMGAVYRARHVKVGRTFAIKVLHPRFSGEERTHKRFAREAEVAGTLHHANVVSVVDVGDLADGRRYLVMEYAEGITLLDLINETAPMSPPRVISLVRQLCNGLQHAHELGLIHRDFKPDNVIVERDRHGNETPRIVDFGTAILREEAVSPGAERLTTKGLVLGTPHYMSPEHATGSAIDHRIDLFALGVTCFEMLTGRSPYEGDGVDVARANLLLDTPVMSERVPGLVVDPLLEAFTRKMMMKSRDDRPDSAADARELIDLIEHDRHAAAAALGVTLDEPSPPPVRPAAQSAPFVAGPGSGPPAAGAPPRSSAGPDAAMMAASAAATAPGLTTAPGWPTPAGAMPWPVPPPQMAWQPAMRSPSAPPYGNLPGMRFKPVPEATEQIAQMGSRGLPLRFIIPAIAALAVLVTMVIAVRGRDDSKRIEFSSLGAGSPSTGPGNTGGATGTATPAAAPAPTAAAIPPAPTPPPAATAPAPAPPVASVAPKLARASVPASTASRPRATQPADRAPTAPSEIAKADPSSSSSTTSTGTAGSAKPSEASIARPDPPPSGQPITMPLSAAGVAELYASVGRQLKALDESHGSAATANLWPLYLRIHINEVISDSSKLADASSLLYRIEDQISRRGATH
jgi:serine/threonine-protein kinase